MIRIMDFKEVIFIELHINKEMIFYVLFIIGIMRPHGAQPNIEKRRRPAIQLLNQGASLLSVVRRLGASKSSY